MKITAKFSSKCAECAAPIAAGSAIDWDKTTRKVKCGACAGFAPEAPKPVRLCRCQYCGARVAEDALAVNKPRIRGAFYVCRPCWARWCEITPNSDGVREYLAKHGPVSAWCPSYNPADERTWTSR